MVTKKKSTKQLASNARKNQILKLKLFGLNENQIAENLGLTTYRVRKEFKLALKEMNDETSDAVKTVRDTTHHRYEALLAKLYPKVMSEPIDYNALTAILKIIEGQRKLFGIDSEQTDINIDARQQTFTIDENFNYKEELKKKWKNLISEDNVVDSTTS
ncbi:MAG: hypothetical protein Unbinned657contig1001_24 [Prokaryotic dsDNA virus sp.]|nr:MAG: hypothetical protein Unbinned657contig1001_24 [Prokaryotic dsDNA virus sp.]|tara:strand:- start:299 stop:775 length:477 start_codon:yes stop_codon:yes gene_type:complete